jgi:hypothetical protein
MYHLIVAHSALRWLLLASVLLTIYLAWEGRFFKKKYTRLHRVAASTASGLSHVQLLLGFGLYLESPVVKAYWADKSLAWSQSLFFALVHIGLMSTAVVLLTIGASLAKRETDERRRFTILFNYCSLALLLMLVAVPWPFSPLAQRPWIRTL